LRKSINRCVSGSRRTVKEKKKLFFGDWGEGVRERPGRCPVSPFGRRRTNTCVWVMGEVMMMVRLGKE